jgi:hypothetical protein
MPDLFFSNEKEGHFHNIIMPNVKSSRESEYGTDPNGLKEFETALNQK